MRRTFVLIPFSRKLWRSRLLLTSHGRKVTQVSAVQVKNQWLCHVITIVTSVQTPHVRSSVSRRQARHLWESKLRSAKAAWPECQTSQWCSQRKAGISERGGRAWVSADLASIVSRSQTMPLNVLIIWSLPGYMQHIPHIQLVLRSWGTWWMLVTTRANHYCVWPSGCYIRNMNN